MLDAWRWMLDTGYPGSLRWWNRKKSSIQMPESAYAGNGLRRSNPENKPLEPWPLGSLDPLRHLIYHGIHWTHGRLIISSFAFLPVQRDRYWRREWYFVSRKERQVRKERKGEHRTSKKQDPRGKGAKGPSERLECFRGWEILIDITN